MEKNSRIYIAGHRGMVGRALLKALKRQGLTHFILKTHAELDLTSQQAVNAFFEKEKPDYVFLAAAKVGGIHANNLYRGEFIYQNMMIQNNVIHAAYQTGVKRLLFLGSSCIYPKACRQPIQETALLTGPLESTNQPYAVAKISGIELCWSYNRQYGTQYLAVMPCNLYGPGDNYHLENSHVIPALIRKAHEAKTEGVSELTVWGSGAPRREFLYSEDMAEGCVHLMSLSEEGYQALLSEETPPVMNLGAGVDLSIAELAQKIAQTVGFNGKLIFDVRKPDGTFQKLMDVSRIQETGWLPKVSLEEGLLQAYQDFLLREDSSV